MAFKINENLRQNIVSRIPEECTPLETCVFVYYELCKKLRYSLDYYIYEDKYVPFFINPRNLAKVDGEANKDVVCYTFNAIYKEIIEGLNLKGVKFEEGVELDEDGLFPDYHDYILLRIGNAVYDIDSAHGVLQNNDLVDLRYQGETIKGFKLSSVDDKRKWVSANERLELAIKKVEEKAPLENLIDIYKTQKKEDIKKLSLEERFNLYKQMIVCCPEYSILGLNYLNKVKHACFDQMEYAMAHTKADEHLQYFQHTYVREAKTENVKVLIFFNPKGYNKAKKIHNFETLDVYEFDLKSKALKPMRVSEVYAKIENRDYYETDGYGEDVLYTDSMLVNMMIGYEL